MDKIKTVLFEKRKTAMISSISIKRRHRRERPMSFPNLGGPSNVLSQQQSTA
jgi:CO dehydrogenase/acetyl-CoA synthase epsilon subunit